MNKRIFDNLGIRIDLTEIPEYMAWRAYVYPRISFIGKLRRVFFLRKVRRMQFAARHAFLNRVLDEGQRIIDGNNNDD